jgi:hypothetical protein
MLYKMLKQSAVLGISAVLVCTTACKRDRMNETKDNQTEAAGLRSRAQNAKLASDAELPPTCGVSTVNHFITLQYAYQLVNNYRLASRIPGRVCSLYDQGGWVLAETFPAPVIQLILSQPGICSFRVYNGLDTDKRQHLVLVGVDQYGMDPLSRNSVAPGMASSSDSIMPDNPAGEIIVEMGAPCPQACDGVYTGGN